MDLASATAQAMITYPVLFNDFHSWCGDFVSWVFWKAWVLRGMPEDAVTKAELGKFLNREAINGEWFPGENLSMVEAYAKGLTLAELKKSTRSRGTTSGLLVWHDPGDGYVPQPGDIFMADREAGGHISIVASYDPVVSYESSDKDKRRGFHHFLTIDGKSFDYGEMMGERTVPRTGWIAEATKKLPAGKPQGVAQNKRMTHKGKDRLRGFIDTSKLRAALGYR